MKFDWTDRITNEDGVLLEYGVIEGNERVVIIKSGAGGSFDGYHQKYLQIAHMLHELNGCTVICLSNFSNESFERTDVDVIRKVISGIDGEVKLYYIGNSNGSTQGLLFATRHFEFSGMLLINMPLMQNFHKTQEALARVHSEIRLVYGERDPSYDYIPFLKIAAQKETCAARVEIETVPAADHNFVGLLDTFISLATRVLDPIETPIRPKE